MAIGRSARQTPLQNRERLRRDLSAGSPIPYRRIPGQRRRYYNPRTNEQVSEHYVIRIYRPSLSEVERSNTNQRIRQYATTQRIQARSIASTWVARQQALGNTYTIREALSNPEFQELYQRLRVVSYEARHTIIGSDERQAYYAADGEYAQLLVLLGRRLPDAGFPVGESALQVGVNESYINMIVLPALNIGG